MSMRPAPAGRDDFDFLPIWRWIAPIMAILVFMWFENGNADQAAQFQQSGFGFHAFVAGFSLLFGAVVGIPVTAIAGVVRIIFE